MKLPSWYEYYDPIRWYVIFRPGTKDHAYVADTDPNRLWCIGRHKHMIAAMYWLEEFLDLEFDALYDHNDAMIAKARGMYYKHPEHIRLKQ